MAASALAERTGRPADGRARAGARRRCSTPRASTTTGTGASSRRYSRREPLGARRAPHRGRARRCCPAPATSSSRARRCRRTARPAPSRSATCFFLRPLRCRRRAPARRSACASRRSTRATASRCAARVQVEGRDAFELNAQATAARCGDLPAAARARPRRDRRRAAAPAPDGAPGRACASPQEAHLRFGPRWRVLRSDRLRRRRRPRRAAPRRTRSPATSRRLPAASGAARPRHRLGDGADRRLRADPPLGAGLLPLGAGPRARCRAGSAAGCASARDSRADGRSRPST